MKFYKNISNVSFDYFIKEDKKAYQKVCFFFIIRNIECFLIKI